MEIKDKQTLVNYLKILADRTSNHLEKFEELCKGERHHVTNLLLTIERLEEELKEGDI